MGAPAMGVRILIFSIAFLFAVGSIQGRTHGDYHNDPSQASDNSDWFKGDKVRVNVKSRATNTDLTYVAEVNDSGDGRFEITGLDAGKRVSGFIIVVGRRAMCTRGLEMERGVEIDALDATKMAVQMTLGLLSRAFPEGSESVGTSSAVELVDRMDAIEMKTQSASGELPTPWSLKGTANRLAPKAIGFQLSFSCPIDEGAAQKEKLELSGTWENSSTSLVLSDDMQLRGWQIYSLGPTSGRTSEGTIYDYGAVRMRDFPTLGDLRRALPVVPSEKRSPSMRTPGA